MMAADAGAAVLETNDDSPKIPEKKKTKSTSTKWTRKEKNTKKQILKKSNKEKN